VNGGNGGSSTRGMFGFGGLRPSQTEDLRGSPITDPWKQYLKLLQLHVVVITAGFAIALLVGPAAKAIALGLFLAYGTWWFWLGYHDHDTGTITAIGALLFTAADLALFLYWPALLTLTFPWQWWARLYGILLLAGAVWESPFPKARYEQEIVDPSYSAPRTPIDGRYAPQTTETLKRRMGYPEYLPALDVEPPEVIHHTTHHESLRVIDANMHGRAHLIRGVSTRAGNKIRLDDIDEMLAAQPDAGFARSEWVGKEARGWKRPQFDDVRTYLEERGLIQPHSPGNEAALQTWHAKMPDETEGEYWRTMAQVTIQRLREIQND